MKIILALAFLVGLSLLPASAAEIELEYIDASTVALDNPHDLKLSPDGKYLYVSDVGNNRIAVPIPIRCGSSPPSDRIISLERMT